MNGNFYGNGIIFYATFRMKYRCVNENVLVFTFDHFASNFNFNEKNYRKKRNDCSNWFQSRKNSGKSIDFSIPEDEF